MTYQPRVSLIAPKVLSFFRCNKFWYLFATKSEIYIFVWKKNSDKKGKKTLPTLIFVTMLFQAHIYFFGLTRLSPRKKLSTDSSSPRPMPLLTISFQQQQHKFEGLEISKIFWPFHSNKTEPVPQIYLYENYCKLSQLHAYRTCCLFLIHNAKNHHPQWDAICPYKLDTLC